MRRLGALIDGLPPYSALARSMDDSGWLRTGWTLDTELLARLVEVVDLGNRHFVIAHSKKGAPEPRPIQIPRPGQPARPKPSPAQIKAFAASKGNPIVRRPKRKD